MNYEENNAEIRPAEPADRGEIERIWKTVFGDDQEYIDCFLDHYYEAGSAMVLAIGGTIISAVHMVPLGNLVLPETRTSESNSRVSNSCDSNLRTSNSCASIYSFATLPEYQGKGYGKSLLQAAIAEMKRVGYQYDVICPAEESLFGYYQKHFGYHKFFTVREFVWDFKGAIGSDSRSNSENTGRDAGADASADVNANAKAKLQMVSAEAEAYRSARNAFLTAHCGSFIDFDARSLNHQRCISGLYGGDIYILDYGGGHGCCCVEYSDESEVLVKELLIPDPLIPAAMETIKNRFGRGEDRMKYRVRMPEWIGAGYGGTLRNFAMIMPPENGLEVLSGKNLTNLSNHKNHTNRSNGTNDTSAFQTEHGYDQNCFDEHRLDEYRSDKNNFDNHGYYGFAFD